MKDRMIWLKIFLDEEIILRASMNIPKTPKDFISSCPTHITLFLLLQWRFFCRLGVVKKIDEVGLLFTKLATSGRFDFP